MQKGFLVRKDECMFLRWIEYVISLKWIVVVVVFAWNDCLKLHSYFHEMVILIRKKADAAMAVIVVLSGIN